MKKKGFRISLILIVVCAIIIAPIGGLSIQAQEISDADYVENETEYIETEEQESELESDMIIEGGMIEIPPQDGNTAEIQVDGLVVTPVIKDDGSYGLPDGVYAFENLGNSGLFMDIQQDKYLPGYHMQQYAASGNPASTFDRSCLFKITWRAETDSYIIRSMLNNRLTFYFSGNEVLTKEIPPKDADVPDSDTFTLTYIVGSGSFVIKPYNSTYVVAANNTTASGMAGAPNSYLKKSTGIAAGDQGKWLMYRYTGSTQSGVVAHKSISTTNGIEVGTTISIAFKTWTTEIGKNTPHLIVNPDYTDMVTVNDWDDDTYTLTFTPIKAGTFKLRGIIRADGTTTAFRTFALTYYAVPPIVGKTGFIQNVGTEKYVDIEGSSSSEGAIIEQDQFGGHDQIKWIFEVQSSGYFRIKSVYSNKYIGVESNGAPTTVKQYATSSDYTLWRFTETTSGNYKLSCKATEASGYVLAAQSQTAGNGSNLEMTAYTDDNNYRDEWNPQQYVVFENMKVGLGTQSLPKLSNLVTSNAATAADFTYSIVGSTIPNVILINSSTKKITANKEGWALVKADSAAYGTYYFNVNVFEGLFLRLFSSSIELGHSWVLISNYTQDEIEVGACTVEKGDSISIGKFGYGSITGVAFDGILYNEEKSMYVYSQNTYAHSTVSIESEIDVDSLTEINNHINGCYNSYSIWFDNCVHLAVNLWNIATTTSEINIDSLQNDLLGYPDPAKLVEYIQNNYSASYQTNYSMSPPTVYGYYNGEEFVSLN